MRIYIGTDADTARRALEIGITPASRAHTGSHEDSAGPRESAAFLARSLTSDPAIELTTAYAPLNAVLAAGDEKPWGVVELDTDDLDPLRLAPESRWLATFLAGHHDANWMNVAGLWDTRDAERVRAHALLFRHLWRESVEAVGRCVYAGPIERVAIRRVAIFDSKSNDTIAYEPDARYDVAGHRALGRRQAALTEWFFEPVAATRFLDPVELSLLTSDVDVPESYWLRESARERLAEWEQALANRAGLTVLAPRDSCG